MLLLFRRLKRLLNDVPKMAAASPRQVVSTAGLGEYLSARTDIPINNDKIIDPWGEPVLTIIDHDNDMKLRFDDYFYGVYNSNGNEIALSLFAQSQHSLKPHFNERWQIELGVIPRKEP